MFNRSNKKIKKEVDIDLALLEYIQTQGGITFKEPTHIITGDGYIKVLHIYQLPKNLSDNWLDKVFNIPDTVSTIDILTKDVSEVKKNINKSISEELSREINAKNYLQIYDARLRKEKLEMLLDELLEMGEVMKMVDFRIFVKARSLIELEEKTNNIIKSLEGNNYMATVLLNEGKREWQSLWESYTKQHLKPFYLNAQPLLAMQLAYGDPFNYSELIDKKGALLGFTATNGVVLFNIFTKNHFRKHYNALITGDMGSGKSSLLKKLLKQNSCENNLLRIFDVSGEFEFITKEFGGQVIKCNGKDGILNPLEILKSGDDESTSYSNHINKLSTFLTCILPSASDELRLSFENYLKEFYDSYNLTPKDDRVITNLSAKAYPTFSEFLKYIKNKIKALENDSPDTVAKIEILKKKVDMLVTIESAVSNIVHNYGMMFDGHTTIDNITDEKIVTFDISDIKELGNVFIAQMFNMVSLCWDNAINNGKIMKQMWENGEINDDDITNFLVLIDEAHEWVNTRNPLILIRLTKYLREARKYFAGMVFASQSIRDFVPENSNLENIDLIKTLFELTQYKFIFKQDTGSLEIMNKVFKNALTFSQIEEVPYLSMGENFLAISGDKAIKFKVWLSEKYEVNVFKGGK